VEFVRNRFNGFHCVLWTIDQRITIHVSSLIYALLVAHHLGTIARRPLLEKPAAAKLSAHLREYAIEERHLYEDQLS